MCVIEKAFAKINLCLDVVSRRTNGYHNVESIMHTIPLYDTVQLKKSDKITISCTNPDVPTDESNLAYKAAERFFSKIGIFGGASIHIEKKIPMAAGMAGGSSDAAATLRGLNKLYASPLSDAELEEIGATLGADVPFCVRGGTEGVVGVGYDFIKVTPPPKFIYVVACGGEGISTPLMYKEYDNRYPTPVYDGKCDNFTGKTEQLKKALEKGEKEEILSLMFNCFETIAEEQRPKIKEIKQIMKENGCAFSMMSGSGPSVFGIFHDFEKAETAKNKLKETKAAAFVVFDEKND